MVRERWRVRAGGEGWWVGEGMGGEVRRRCVGSRAVWTVWLFLCAGEMMKIG